MRVKPVCVKSGAVLPFLCAALVVSWAAFPPGRASAAGYSPWSGGHDASGVTEASCTWYFAEGCTREGFDTWLCVLNPQETVANLEISFLTPRGNEFRRAVPVSPLSRYTLNVAEVVGAGQDVSMVVRSDLPVVAERPVYFNYRANRSGGHDASGVTEASCTWYFAEGCTREGFDTWLCVLNPQETVANLEISFLTPRGNEFRRAVPVSPLSRYTLNVAEVVGAGQDVSMVVRSDLPVVAERPVYFNYRSPKPSGSYAVAETEGMTLTCPVRYADTTGIMFHEASRYDIHDQPANPRVMLPLGGCVGDANPGARYPGWEPQDSGDPYYWVQESRGRGTFSTTAVDVGAKAGCAVLAPVDGVVECVESYSLYGSYPDQRVSIIPDGKAHLRAVVVHLEATVTSGTRVRAGITELGRVRRLSQFFVSDLGRYYTGEEGDHVHMQVNLAP